MLAIRIELLAGRFTATAHHRRDRGEWPPHPARVYSALVAEWADTPEPDPAEAAALDRLAALGPPAISCSTAVQRSVATHFVPVNDLTVVDGAWSRTAYRKVRAAQDALADPALTAAKVDRHHKAIEVARDLKGKPDASATTASGVKSAVGMLPAGRGKQPRTFPTMVPADPVVVYRWEDDVTEVDRTSLAGLLDRVSARSGVSRNRRGDGPPPGRSDSQPASAVAIIRPAALRRIVDRIRGIAVPSLLQPSLSYLKTIGCQPLVLSALLTPNSDGLLVS